MIIPNEYRYSVYNTSREMNSWLFHKIFIFSSWVYGKL